MRAENRMVVARPCQLGNVDRLIGEVVDASSWKWKEELEKQHTIKVVQRDHEHVTCGCGRHWMDLTAMEIHSCSDTASSPSDGEPDGTKTATEKAAREPVKMVPRSPGWFDVVVRGEKVNAKALRLAAAQKMIANLELMPEAEVQ